MQSNSRRKTLLAILLLSLLTAAAGSAQETGLSSDEDHQRLLQLLGIESLRRGADGDPASPHAANYDEALANAHMGSLPDPLRMDDGSAVRDAQDWWQRRRPEIAEHFEREIYGRIPSQLPAINWVVISNEQIDSAGRPLVRQVLRGQVDNSLHPQVEVNIDLRLTLPAKSESPVPVLLALVIDEATLALWRSRFTEAQWQSFQGEGPTWQEQVAARGWGYAELAVSSVQADSGAGLGSGIIGLVNRGEARGLEDWGALRAWAWSASSVLDYLQGRSEVDSGSVALFGHSRYGKAALVAMAFDTRFATAFISSSGEGGAKLWRRNFGEQVGNIAGSGEYHWTAGNFLRYAGPLTVADLPVDAHALIALCAPRPLFISSGTDGDQWVDPKGMFLAAAHAGPVYDLLGARPLPTHEYPPVGTALVEGELAWRQHEQGHTPGPNWPYFLDFAERHFNRPLPD